MNKMNVPSSLSVGFCCHPSSWTPFILDTEGSWANSPPRRLKLFHFPLCLCVINHKIMYKPCGADSLISILKGSRKRYIYSGDSQSEMRLTGIVSHQMPRKGEDFPQAAGSLALSCRHSFFCSQSLDCLSQHSRVSGKPSVQSVNFKESRKLL